MYRQEFFIVAKKDEDIMSSNFHKLLALRSDHAGIIESDDAKWTDNIFLAKHFRKEKDAATYASKQLNMDLIVARADKENLQATDYKILKVFIDVEGNSQVTSKLYIDQHCNNEALV